MKTREHGMDFSSRIKKEMAEGIVRAILEDAGYRVIDAGLEKYIRELACLPADEYHALDYPDAMRHLPDFTVMDREQSEKFLVEVKYRSQWSRAIFDEVKAQVRSMENIVLVSIHANAPNPHALSYRPARFIRCCGLRWQDGVYQVERRIDGAPTWVPVETLEDDERLWWSMSRLDQKFSRLRQTKENRTLVQAIESLQGILNVQG